MASTTRSSVYWTTMACGGDVMRKPAREIAPYKTAVITTLILLTLLPFTASQAWTLFPRTVFEAKPFSGKIVDAETGQPIPNAVVYVNWPKTTSTFGGSNQNGTVEVQEAVSDSSGQYKMLGWKKSRKEVGKGWFSKSAPKMVIYASGYWPELLHNRISSDNYLARNEVWKSDMDGKTIELKPMHSEGWNSKQWRKYKNNVSSYLSLYFIPVCGWLKLPNYYLAQDRIGGKAYRLAYPTLTQVISTTLSGMLTERRSSLEKECGVDPKAFFLSNGMTNKEFDECCSDDPTKRAGYEKNIWQPVMVIPPPEVAKPNGGKK